MDIRGQRTEAAIKDAFLELLRQRPAGEITVTALCQRAALNRATFYKHYTDIADLQSSLEEEVLQELEAFFKGSASANGSRYRSLLMQMLSYMGQNSSRFYLLCSRNTDSELPAKAFRLVSSYAFPLIREKVPAMAEEKAALLYRFLTRGCGEVLACWLRGESSLEPEELTNLLMQISQAAVTALAEEASP